MSLLNAALLEKEAAALQAAAAGSKTPQQGFEEGLHRTITMLDQSIKILELEPPNSTELRWLQIARDERQEVCDLIVGLGGREDDGQ